MNTDNKLHIEVWSDVVCPFCFIGKRHYEQALAQFEHADDVVLEWKSYQLDRNLYSLQKDMIWNRVLLKV